MYMKTCHCLLRYLHYGNRDGGSIQSRLRARQNEAPSNPTELWDLVLAGQLD